MQQFVTAISTMIGCARVDDLARVMDALARDQGCAGFNYICHMPSAGEPEPFYLTTLRADFVANYRRENFFAYDPAVARCERTNESFTWSDCPEFQEPGRRRRGPRTKPRQIIEAAHDFGYTQGLVTPVHFVGILGERASALVSVFWQGALNHFATPGPQSLWMRMAVMTFHERVLHLRGVVYGNPSQRPVLTDRERDCLVWAARGKTVRETGDTLAITERTVEFHIQNVMRKLGVHSKVHAIAVAIHRGLITP
jgi:DNA-binding CsgD family transcriptional regulator